MEEKERKAKAEYQKIKTKHDNETNALQMKHTITEKELQKNRALALDQ
jgi:hypothetical protein